MVDLIDRQVAIDGMMRLEKEDDEMYGCSIPEGFDGKRAKEALEKLPSAEPERKKGEWIHERLMSTTGGSYPVTRCSECQNALPFEWDANFCPNCGADMRKEGDTDEG